MKSASAELKIVIPGNHDLSLDSKYYYGPLGERHRHRRGDNPSETPESIRAMYTSPEAVESGIVYLEEGIRTFNLRGGQKFTVYASAYTPEFCGWAFPYERDVDRFNPPHPGASSAEGAVSVPGFPGVDVMLTHGPPLGVLDAVRGGTERVGCEWLMKAVRRARPRLHVFGHIHEGYGAQRVRWGMDEREGDVVEDIRADLESVLEDRGAFYDMSSSGEAASRPLGFGDETLFVNASVVTLAYRPINAPWIVDLDLPVAG